MIIRSVSYRNQYWVYRIESYRLLLYRGKPDITCITADSAAVNRLHYTGRSKDIRAPSPAARVRRLIVHDTGESWRGGRRKETVTFYQPPHDTKTAQYWVLATRDRWRRTPPPGGSDTNSQLWITQFLQVNQSQNWLSPQVGLLLIVCMCHPLRISCVLQVTCLV